MIFIDSDAYIGLNTVGDAHHQKALQLYRILQAKKELCVTTWEVVDEVATKLSFHASQKTAHTFLHYILNSEVRIEYVTPMLVSDIQSVFRKQASQKVSMTDCANMVIARKLGITTFFSFDRHYERNGFTLLKAS